MPLMEIIALTCFKCFPNILLKLPHCYIYSPTCQTVASDPLFWYLGPDFPLLKEEPERAGELQCIGEWQADNVV